MSLSELVTIVIGYPPVKSEKGTPMLSQNRQFQYFHSPSFIYPMVPASAATQLANSGYTVYWMDGIAEQKSYDDWVCELETKQPNYLMIETKTPVIKTHWKQINDLKRKVKGIQIILVGDHVTFLPFESFKRSLVDYIITGGDYDFAIVNLLNHIYRGERLEGGIYWRNNDSNIGAKPLLTTQLNDNRDVNTSGPPNMQHNLDKLPFIDRRLTKWELYAYKNGNYKYTPATYMYSGRDCWWNRCTFCVWAHTLNPVLSYRSFSPKRLFAEVKDVVDNYGVKEIFDDAGTFFIGPKLKRFCEILIDSGYNKRVRYGCNLRMNALIKQKDYDLLAKAGFRFILFGMESANQQTLDKLDKGMKKEWIVKGSKMAACAGLDPHLTIMLGYPWETYDDAKRTLDLAKYCLKKGYAKTMQATIVIPYPGTPLWEECKQNGWLLTKDYNRYDMREPVMRIPYSTKQLYDLVKELYSAFISPQYLLRTISEIRNIKDIKFLFTSGKKLFGHLSDFDKHTYLI